MTQPVNPSTASAFALRRKRELLARVDAAGALLDDLAILLQRVELPEPTLHWLAAYIETIGAHARDMLQRVERFNGAGPATREEE